MKRTEIKSPSAHTDTITVLKALADETRLRIVSLLLEAGDLCSCEIEAVLDLSQPNVSRHLTRLRYVGLLRSEKRGQWVHFHISGDSSTRNPVLSVAVTAAREDLPLFADDLARLRDYRASSFDCRTIDEWRKRRRYSTDAARE